MLSKKEVMKHLTSVPLPDDPHTVIPTGPESKEFFWCLLRADQPMFFLKTPANTLWQRSGDDGANYLLAFSHKDLAENYSKEHAPDTVVMRAGFPDWLAMIRRAVFCGSIVSYNESETSYFFDPWNILSIVNKYFEKNSCSLYTIDNDMRKYLSFVQKVRNNATNQLYCVSGRKNMITPIIDSGIPYYRVCVQPDESCAHPLTLSALYCFFGTVQVTIGDEKICLDSEKLKQVLHLSRVISPASSYIPAVLCTNEPAPPISAKITELCLDLTFDSTDDVPEEQNDVPSTSEPETDAGENADDDITFVFDEEDDDIVIDVTKSQPFYREEKKRKIKEIYPSDDPGRAKKKLMLYALIPFFVVFLILLFVLGTQLKLEKASRFSSYLKSEKYELAMSVYKESSNTTEYDEQIVLAISRVVSAYSYGKISKEKAEKILENLSDFPKTSTSIASAEARIAAICESKTAFALGQDSDDIGERIIQWSRVIPDDVENYSSVSEFVSEEADEYVEYVFSSLKQGTPVEKESLIALADSSCVLFPNHSGEITAAKGEYLARCELLSKMPVAVSDLSILHNDDNNSITLLIRWKNQSDRVIRQVDFQFEFFDANNNLVSYEDESGERKAEFFGRESAGAYAPDYETPENPPHGWKDLFSGIGSKISIVRVARMDVRFEDESELSIVFSESD